MVGTVAVVFDSNVTQICGNRTAVQTGRHELRRAVNLVAECDERRRLDDEVATDPERVSGERDFQIQAVGFGGSASAVGLSTAACRK